MDKPTGVESVIPSSMLVKDSVVDVDVDDVG